MGAIAASEVESIEPFLPSRDLATSTRFYEELGFELVSENPGLNVLALGGKRFYLQDVHVKEWAENQMIQLRVSDVDSIWARIEALDLASRYEGVRLLAPQDQPWGVRELNIIDPAGVCWHICSPI